MKRADKCAEHEIIEYKVYTLCAWQGKKTCIAKESHRTATNNNSYDHGYTYTHTLCARTCKTKQLFGKYIFVLGNVSLYGNGKLYGGMFCRNASNG